MRLYIILEYNIFLNWEGNRKEKRHRRRRPGHHVDKIWLWLDIYIFLSLFFSRFFSHYLSFLFEQKEKEEEEENQDEEGT